MTVHPITTQPQTLSAAYGGSDDHRARATDHISWLTATKGDCDECFALQHETGGASTRQRAHHQRVLRGGAKLLLCTEHAELWQARDREDVRGRAS